MSSADVECNPGPDTNVSDSNLFTIGHVNVRSLAANAKDPVDQHCNICKFDLIMNHVLFYAYDIFGISETWLDKNVDLNVNIEGYHNPEQKDFRRGQRSLMVYISNI